MCFSQTSVFQHFDLALNALQLALVWLMENKLFTVLKGTTLLCGKICHTLSVEMFHLMYTVVIYFTFQRNSIEKTREMHETDDFGIHLAKIK
jgi:hypothetical protein